MNISLYILGDPFLHGNQCDDTNEHFSIIYAHPRITSLEGTHKTYIVWHIKGIHPTT